MICNYNVREESNAENLMLDLFLNVQFYAKNSQSKVRCTSFFADNCKQDKMHFIIR